MSSTIEALTRAYQAVVNPQPIEIGDKEDMKEAMDPVNHKALKKDFKDREDKDIDNDGDVDKSDEYLHKRRKAVSKAVKGETAKMNPKMKTSGTSEQKEAVNTADKKPEDYMGADGKMHTRMVPAKKNILKKEGTIRDRLMSVLEKREDHYKSATAPEEIDSKDSPNAKKMRADHSAEVAADINKVSDDVAKAAAATKVSPKNSTDKGAKGDMKVVNPVQDVTKQGGFKESVMSIWNAYKSVVEKK